jgi:hypothetical protein
MGSFFIGNPEIAAGLPPFRTMGGQPPTPMAIMGQEMGKFMKQCLLDLDFGDIAKGRVQPDLPTCCIGDSSRRSHPEIPPNGDQAGKFGGKRVEKHSRALLKQGVAFFRVSRNRFS